MAITGGALRSCLANWKQGRARSAISWSGLSRMNLAGESHGGQFLGHTLHMIRDLEMTHCVHLITYAEPEQAGDAAEGLQEHVPLLRVRGYELDLGAHDSGLFEQIVHDVHVLGHAWRWRRTWGRWCWCLQGPCPWSSAPCRRPGTRRSPGACAAPPTPADVSTAPIMMALRIWSSP